LKDGNGDIKFEGRNRSPWTSKEQSQLLFEASLKYSDDKMALLHNRSKVAIQKRLRLLRSAAGRDQRSLL
jgi:hypothetical protein